VINLKLEGVFVTFNETSREVSVICPKKMMIPQRHAILSSYGV